MDVLRVTAELVGLDRVLYEQDAVWERCSLRSVDAASVEVQLWEPVNDQRGLNAAAEIIRERLRRLILALEWVYGRELRVTLRKIEAPGLEAQEGLTVIADTIVFRDEPSGIVAPRLVPPHMPEVPVEAERWIRLRVEATKLSGYVEEQLRRHYLIIEELWQEFYASFTPAVRLEKKRVKLVRDFVSHARCENEDVVAIVESGLPSAVVTVNGRKSVVFERNVEHRNFVAHFETAAYEIARVLVEMKMSRLGVVRGV